MRSNSPQSYEFQMWAAEVIHRLKRDGVVYNETQGQPAEIAAKVELAKVEKLLNLYEMGFAVGNASVSKRIEYFIDAVMLRKDTENETLRKLPFFPTLSCEELIAEVQRLIDVSTPCRELDDQVAKERPTVWQLRTLAFTTWAEAAAHYEEWQMEGIAEMLPKLGFKDRSVRSWRKEVKALKRKALKARNALIKAKMREEKRKAIEAKYS